MQNEPGNTQAKNVESSDRWMEHPIHLSTIYFENSDKMSIGPHLECKICDKMSVRPHLEAKFVIIIVFLT